MISYTFKWLAKLSLTLIANIGISSLKLNEPIHHFQKLLAIFLSSRGYGHRTLASNNIKCLYYTSHSLSLQFMLCPEEVQQYSPIFPFSVC